MDIVTYKLSQKYADKVAAGFSSVRTDGLDIIFTLNNGKTATVTIPAPEDGHDGVSITDVSLNQQSHLICTLSDGTTVDAGLVHQGVDGKDGTNGSNGLDGKSAYQIWIDEGNSGTEQDFLDSLKGEGADTQEIESELSDLREENTRLKNDLNATTLSVSATGENIQLNNTANARFKKFVIKGNSKQATREGYNLLDNTATSQIVKDVEFSVNDDKSITLNGTATGNIKFRFNSSFNLQENTDYIVYSGVALGAGNALSINSINDEVNYAVSSTNSRNFNTGSKTEFYAYIYILSGKTFDNFTIYPMIVKSADFETIPPYEQYGKTPSAQYPSEIKNVTGNVVVKIQDENNTKSQTIIMLLLNEKLMSNDRLSDTGIKIINEEVELTGNETWSIANRVFYADLLNSSYSGNVKYTDMLCTHFNFGGSVVNTSTAYSKGNNSFCVSSSGNAGRRFYFREDSITSVEDWVSFLQLQVQKGVPVKVNYQLLVARDVPYTAEQQAVYNQIKNTIKSYSGKTNIYSTNEVSPVFDVVAYKDINSVIESLDNRITLIE